MVLRVVCNIAIVSMLFGGAALAQPLPDTVPVPEPRPAAETPEEAAPTASPPTLPPMEMACRRDLERLGVRFSPHETISEPEGCAISNPLEIETLSPSIDLEPPATLNCATARAAANFVKDIVGPKAREYFGTGVSAIANASGYVCRPRAGTRKLSEHARGNALDISSVVLEDGRRIDVATAYDDKEKSGPFMDALRKAACGPFKTVLGPGADADHADHLHLDLAYRRNGGTFCQ